MMLEGLFTLMAMATLAGCVRLSWRFLRKFEAPLRWILGGGLFVRVVYLFSTRVDEQANDWFHHLLYIQNLYSKSSLLKNDGCFECYHPPAYHLIGAYFIPIFDYFKIEHGRGVQWITLLLFMVALIAMIDLIRKLIADKALRYLASAMVVFWPRAIPLSVTINNDVGIYLFAALALNAIIDRREGEYAGWSVAAILTKTSGALLYPIGVIYTWIIERRVQFRVVREGLLIAGLVLAAGFTYWNRTELNTNTAIISNTPEIPGAYRLANGWDTFVCFEITPFLDNPDIGLVVEGKGRQCFWNFLLKTSLVTELDVVEPLHQFLSKAMSWLLLFVIFFAGAGSAVMFLYSRNQFWFHTLVIFWFLLAQGVIRYLLPMGATNDFRYVYSIIPSIACFAVTGVTLFEDRGRVKLLRYASMGILYLFIATSLLYYMVTVKR